MPELALADELFVMGHDEYSGKPRINHDVLSVGLAAAALGELLIAETLTVDGGRVTGWTAKHNGDPVTDQIVAQLQKVGPGHRVHQWVEHLRGDIKELVAYRLVGHGAIRRETSRSFTGRTQTRFPATDPTEATRPVVRLGFLIGRPGDFDPQSALLACIATAIDLNIVAPTLSPSTVRQRLADLPARLVPGYRDLLAAVDTAVAAVALQAHG
ncbi:GOLPH3/VPS74 family protein [Catellatospora vulcania]|uniref:GOLPH3/VPS74 family protein n=1 Tax=Catellatospora vulcania TaxID=1460450 RepID=UPI0012D385BB|nr:GPP34 family phosphoprotein [Catellatospora vulcania]